MERPKNVDIWDGVELRRDETLTEEQKQTKLAEVMEMIKQSVKQLYEINTNSYQVNQVCLPAANDAKKSGKN